MDLVVLESEQEAHENGLTLAPYSNGIDECFSSFWFIILC